MAIISSFLIIAWLIYAVFFTKPIKETGGEAVKNWCAANGFSLVSLEFKNRFASPFANARKRWYLFFFVRAIVLENGRERAIWLLLRQVNVNPTDANLPPEIIETAWEDGLDFKAKRSRIVVEIILFLVAIFAALLFGFYFKN